MPTLYLMDHGAKLRHSHQRLLVEKDGQLAQDLPLAHVDEVVVGANALITTPTLKLLLFQGIDTVYLTEDGQFCGRLAGPQSNVGDLRRRQYVASLDTAFALGVARAFVDGKARNMRALLLRYNRERRDGAIASAADQLDTLVTQITNATALPALLGLEGAASAAYFAALPRLLKREWGFERRNRRPPADPVNVLLSFGYTLLAKAMESAALTAGLDPAIGFLHQPLANRPALALDLMEEFRPVVADSTMLRCLNAGLILPEHFTAGEASERPVILAPAAAKTFVMEFEARLGIEFAHPAAEERVTYRRCFELQARSLVAAIRGTRGYAPFVVR